MVTYRSKIGSGLIIPVSIIVGGTGALMVYERIWIGMIITLLAALFIAHMFLTTNYRVEGNKLKIRSGFLFERIINIDTIREIKATRNPSSSPATSFDRLLITYNEFETIMVSPKKKEAFISQLLSINPGIVVNNRNG